MALCIIAVGVRMVIVHNQTRDWRLTPAAARAKLAHHDHSYLRGRPGTPATDVPGPTTPTGQTSGGGEIFVPTRNASDGSSPSGLVVQDGTEKYSYALLGGG